MVVEKKVVEERRRKWLEPGERTPIGDIFQGDKAADREYWAKSGGEKLERSGFTTSELYHFIDAAVEESIDIQGLVSSQFYEGYSNIDQFAETFGEILDGKQPIKEGDKAPKILRDLQDAGAPGKAAGEQCRDLVEFIEKKKNRNFAELNPLQRVIADKLSEQLSERVPKQTTGANMSGLPGIQEKAA